MRESGGGHVVPQHPWVSTCQLPVVQFEAAEWVGAIEEHMPFGVHRLQLLQRGLAASETLRRHGPSVPAPCILPEPAADLPSHLTLAPEAPLLQPGPDALDPPCVFGMSAVVPTGTLVLQHHRVIDEP